MTIKRIVEGRQLEFELTAEEMRRVYEELQAEYDRDDVRTLFDSYSDEDLTDMYGYPRAALDPYVGEIADEMRRMIYKYDVDWDYARETAASEIMGKYAPEYT